MQAPAGEWFLVYLCSRPIGPQRRCIPGSETALQRRDWPAGEWPRLAGGGNAPSDTVEAPGTAPCAPPYRASFTDDFDAPVLPAEWNTQPEPAEATWLDLAAPPGFLRLRGRRSLNSLFGQSLVGVRLAQHRCRIATRLDFSPHTWQQTAGLALYYHHTQFLYLHITADDTGYRVLRLLQADHGKFSLPLGEDVPLPGVGAVELGFQMDREALRASAILADAN